MTVMTMRAKDVFAGVNADGTPRQIRPDHAQIWGMEVERGIAGATAGRVDQITWTGLAAITGTRAGQPAQVLGPDAGTHPDPVVGGTAANTGTYAWSTSPAGWRRIGGLPTALVHASNSGAGTGNAVQAATLATFNTSAYQTLITINFVAANSGAMTISINAESPRDLVLNTGGTIPSGYISAGMSALLQIDSNGDYRLFSYGDASAIQAAAEALLGEMQELYLGSYANDGAATAAAEGSPSVGAMYWNTAENEMRVWDGGVWQEFAGGIADGSIDWPKLADALVQTDAEGGDDDADDELPTVKRVATMISTSSGGRLTPFQFGALPDGSDCEAALVAAFAEMDSSGKPLDLGPHTWTVFDTLEYTFTRTPRIYGDGATIKLNRGASAHVARAVSFTGKFGADFRGWKVDANRQAYNGLVIVNSVSSMAEADIFEVFLEDVGAENAYRSNTTHVGGFGIWVYGAHRLVHMVRPKVKNIAVANGAAVMSTIGAHGIAVSHNGAYEARDIIIQDPWVEEVYSEDSTYAFDQDGIQIFRAPPLAFSTVGDRGSAVVTGGMFINCRGRGIKMASANARVEGCHFERTPGAFTGRGFLEIDFQYGEGVVKDCTYHHQGQSVEKIVGTTAGEYASSGLYVENLRGYIETASTPRPDYIVVRHTPAVYAASPVVVKNCVHQGDYPDYYLYHKSGKTSSTSPFENVTVENVTVSALGNGLIHRDGGTMQAIVRGCANAGGSVPTVVNINSAATTILPGTDRGNIGLS